MRDQRTLDDVMNETPSGEQEGLKLSIGQQIASSPEPEVVDNGPSVISMSQPGITAKPKVNINNLRNNKGNRTTANLSNLPVRSEVPNGMEFKTKESLEAEIFEPGGVFDNYLKEKTNEYTQYINERRAKADQLEREKQIYQEDKDIDKGDEYEVLSTNKKSAPVEPEILDRETKILKAKEYKMVDIKRPTKKEESMGDVINGSVQEFANPDMVENQEYPIYASSSKYESPVENQSDDDIETEEDNEDYLGSEDYITRVETPVQETTEEDQYPEDLLEDGEEIEEEYEETENFTVEEPKPADKSKGSAISKKIDRITKAYMAIPSEDDEDEVEVADEDNDESIKILKNMIAKKIKPVSLKMDITGFTVAKKGTMSNEIFTIDKASFAKWPLPATGIVVEMKEISGVNLENLRGYLDRRVPDNRAALKIIYDHIVSPKPTSFETWLHSIAYADFDHLFMLVYISAFADANFLPVDCTNSDCGKPYITDNIPVMDLVKFKNKESEDKFWDLYNEAPTDAKGLYTTQIIPISDKFAIGLKEPSLYSVLIEPNYFNNDFMDKYAQTIRYFPYIDSIYWIDAARSTLVPIKWRIYDNNASKSARSRVRKYAMVMDTLTSDQHSLIMSYINAINERIDWFNYRLPETTCPHCGEVVAADDSYSALSLVFLRNRLAVLATT